MSKNKLSIFAFIISVFALADVSIGLLPLDSPAMPRLAIIFLSLILSIISLIQIRTSHQKGKIFAIVAIIIAFIALYPYLLYFTV